jgi:hypothetical protein
MKPAMAAQCFGAWRSVPLSLAQAGVGNTESKAFRTRLKRTADGGGAEAIADLTD